MKSRKKDTQTRSMKKRKEGDRKKKEKWENGRIDESTTERMSTRTDGRMDGWMNEWVSETQTRNKKKKKREKERKKVDERINEGTNAHRHGRTDGWMNEWLSEWKNEWMNKWMKRKKIKKDRPTDHRDRLFSISAGSLLCRRSKGVTKLLRMSALRLIRISDHRKLLNSWSELFGESWCMLRATCDLIHLHNVTSALIVIHTSDRREKA